MSVSDSVGGNRKVEFIPIEVFEAECDSLGNRLKNEIKKAHMRINDLEEELLTKDENFSKDLKQKQDRCNSLSLEMTKQQEENVKLKKEILQLEKSHSRCNSLSLEMTKQQEENVKLKKEILQLEKSHSREQLYLTKMNEENKKHIESLNAHIKSMNTEIQELNCEHSKETEQLKFDLNEAKHVLTCKFNEDRVQKTEMEYKIHKLEEENVKYCEMVKNLNAEIKTLESKMELTQTSISDMELSIQTQKEKWTKEKKDMEKMQTKQRHDIDNATKREDKLEQQIKNSEEIIKKKEGEIKDFYKRTSENKGYIEILHTHLQEITSQKTKDDYNYKEHVKELQACVADEKKNFYDLSYQYNQLIQQNNAFAENLRQVNKEKAEIEHEKQELMLRLSKLAGANLTYNDPNIADLSDEKRPTKLAEEFSELFDNEWTDAYEDMPIEDDRQKTTLMLEMLKHANEICRNAIIEHTNAIKRSFCTLTLQTDLSMVLEDVETTGVVYDEVPGRLASTESTSTGQQQVKCYDRNGRKNTTKHERTIVTEFEQTLKTEQIHYIMEIGRVFGKQLSEGAERVGTEIILEELNINQHQECLLAYIRKCTNICWSVCRHVPPVHVDFPDVTEDTPFDTNKYKPYTKSGKWVHYIVWPAVYLHDGGPLLYKGVAQGRK